jgi:hypothetical protein
MWPLRTRWRPGVGTVESANDVWHLGMRRNDTVGQPLLVENGGDEFGRAAGVAGWVGTSMPDEVLQEADKLIAVKLEPIQQLVASRTHARSPWLPG